MRQRAAWAHGALLSVDRCLQGAEGCAELISRIAAAVLHLHRDEADGVVTAERFECKCGVQMRLSDALRVDVLPFAKNASMQMASLSPSPSVRGCSPSVSAVSHP